jgi:hypothetical protein
VKPCAWRRGLRATHHRKPMINPLVAMVLIGFINPKSPPW